MSSSVRGPEVRCLRATEDSKQESHGCKGVLIALRTRAELHAALQTTLAYVIEIPAKSANSVLQYVKSQVPLAIDLISIQRC